MTYLKPLFVILILVLTDGCNRLELPIVVREQFFRRFFGYLVVVVFKAFDDFLLKLTVLVVLASF